MTETCVLCRGGYCYGFKGITALTDSTDPLMSRTQINSAPGNTPKGVRQCCVALEKRKRKLGEHVQIYSYMNRDSVF